MPNFENDWNRNRRDSNQDWNDTNRYGRNRTTNFDEDYDDRRMDRNYDNRNYGYTNWGSNQESNRGNWGNNDFEGGRYSGNSDYNDIGNKYGRSSNLNRESSSNWMNRESRPYPGSDYGYGNMGSYNRNRYDNRYNNDMNRNSDRDWWDKTRDEVSSWFGDDEAARRRRMDEMRERRGEHRGKGPKGYTRSDERIKEDVNDRLSDDAHIDASDIDVSVDNSEVTLSGTVNSRWEKRHAEDIVESISGVKNVENRIKVNSSTTFGSTNMGRSSDNKSYM